MLNESCNGVIKQKVLRDAIRSAYLNFMDVFKVIKDCNIIFINEKWEPMSRLIVRVVLGWIF